MQKNADYAGERYAVAELLCFGYTVTSFSDFQFEMS